MDQPSKYEGPSGGLRAETPWLGVEDLEGHGDVVVTILDVVKYGTVQFEKGPPARGVGALVFKKSTKKLTINKARRNALEDLFGKDTKAWRNKRITLYIDPKVKMKGEQTGGVRIRPTVPK